VHLPRTRPETILASKWSEILPQFYKMESLENGTSERVRDATAKLREVANEGAESGTDRRLS